MKWLGRIFLVLVAIVAVAVTVWYLLGRSEVTAELAAISNHVQRLDARTSRQESVPAGERCKIHAEDGVTVDQRGRARLSVEDCVWEVFCDTGLRLQQLPEESARACVVQLSHGTIYNQVEVKTVVETEWAVVTALSTRFLVYLDPDRGLLWALVKDGVVEVAARNEVVRLAADEQTWVFRGKPPEQPRPARRSEVDPLNLPAVEVLTNGELGDDEVFLPEEAVSEIQQPAGWSGVIQGTRNYDLSYSWAGGLDTIERRGSAKETISIETSLQYDHANLTGPGDIFAGSSEGTYWLSLESVLEQYFDGGFVRRTTRSVQCSGDLDADDVGVILEADRQAGTYELKLQLSIPECEGTEETELMGGYTQTEKISSPPGLGEGGDFYWPGLIEGETIAGSAEGAGKDWTYNLTYHGE